MKKIISNIIFILSISVILAQNPTLYETYSIADGLSQTTVTCIFQSSDGLMWFGTQDGLNEYDGYNFTIFKHDPENDNSLSDNYINDITEDQDGNLIIATRGAGITIWERSKNKFTKFVHDKKNPYSISSDAVLSVIFHDGTFWCLTENSLEKYLGNGKFKHFVFSDTLLSTDLSSSIQDLLVDNKNRIWIASDKGLFTFYPENEQFFKISSSFQGLSSQKAKTLFLDKENNIWIGTDKGLNKFNEISGSFSSFFYYGKNELIRENSINSIFIDDNDNFWVGTKNGLKIFNGKEIIEPKDLRLRTINEQISSIIQDKSGMIWVGTYGQGIAKFSFKKLFFDNFSGFPTTAARTIFSIYAHNDNIWVGSSGIFLIDKNQKSILYHNDLKFSDSITDVTVYSIFQDNGKLWLGTDLNIFILDTATKNIKTIFDFFKIPVDNRITFTRINQINKDSSGNYWFSTNNGLFKFNGKKIEKISFKEGKKQKNNSRTIISTFFDDNKVWICTYKGLILYDTIAQTYKFWLPQKKGLPSNFIFQILKQNDTTYWIATTSGLTLFNPETENFTTFTSMNTGFKNDFFYNMILDKQDNLWLSSNNGITKFNTKTHNFITYSDKNGLPFLECDIGAIYQDTLTQTLYFGGTNGIAWCSLYNNYGEENPFNVIITKIEISGNLQKKKTIFFPANDTVLKFNYKDIIKVHYTLPNYFYSNNNKFKFKIIGFNDNWSEEQNLNFIYLTGLSPGKYTLLIKASDGNGVWYPNQTALKFEIIPPFYKTLWAKLIYIFTAIIILAGIFFYVINNIKKENKILQEKNKILKEVEKQRKLLEEKNKNITDSINYARKIIDAILPPVETFKNILPESFIYFLPKDIVSGDFYWFAEKNDHIYIAAVDCTGHGIPGAFMSIIGMNLLEKLVNDGYTEPAIMLNLMNKAVIETLKKDSDRTHLKDGMDMSLCIIDKKRKTLKFSGAYNPAYIIRDENIIQLKGDRKSVGNDFENISFSSFSQQLKKDDIIYIFSDGYTDQFGGEERKKFKFRRFRFLLLSIHKLPPEEQKNKLHQTLIDWKKDYEQVDDILIIGFKPLSFLDNTTT